MVRRPENSAKEVISMHKNNYCHKKFASSSSFPFPFPIPSMPNNNLHPVSVHGAHNHHPVSNFAANCHACHRLAIPNSVSVTTISSLPSSSSSSSSSFSFSSLSLSLSLSASSASSASSLSTGKKACNCTPFLPVGSLFLSLLMLCAILARLSSAAPYNIRTVSGQKLILHTVSYRQQQHNQLLQRERTQPPITSTTLKHHRHHLHLRSVNMDKRASGDNNNNNIWKHEWCPLFKQAIECANGTISNIQRGLGQYLENVFQTTVEAMHIQGNYNTLGLHHAYNEQLSNRRFDEDFIKQSDIENSMNNPVQDEVEKIYNALSLLAFAIDKIMENWGEERDTHNHDRNRNATSYDYFKELRKVIDCDRDHAGAIYKNVTAVPINLTTEEPIFTPDVSDIEWMVIKEAMSMLKYFIAYYERAFMKCDESLN